MLLFSCSVVSDSLWPSGLRHSRLPCLLLSPRVFQTHVHRVDATQLSHPMLPSPSPALNFPRSGSYPISWFFASGPQSIGASASALVLPMNIQGWFPLGLTGLISLQSKGLAQVFSNTTVQSINSSALSLLYSPTLTSIHDQWKNHSLTRRTFVGKVMSLLFNMLSRLVITFFPRSKHLNFMAAITICSNFGAPQNKVWHCFHCFPIYLPWSDGTRCHDLHFLNVEL